MKPLHSRAIRFRGVRLVELLALGAAAVLIGSSGTARADQLAAGKKLYVDHCAACHGEDAKGGGPMAEALKQKPTDLTQIAKGAGGTFPSTKTMEVISGTADVRAHGSEKMPVWGSVFRGEATAATHKRGQARGQVMLLTEYLKSIQEK